MLPKGPYKPQEHEDKIYQLWEKGGHFRPAQNSNKPAFTIIMPPPNANAPLHAGHAIFVTLEDLMIRYHRMKGEPTLWLPGADHAGFETQVVFEKKLEKENKSRFDYDRKKLYQMMWKFTLKNKKQMYNQLKKLGASCDWTREKFTLDKDIIEQVYQTFEKLYNDGLVYRGERVVNWCVKHQTALSDLEIKHEDETGSLWYINYPLVDTTGNATLRYITVATTRPETMLGDTAVAVHPDDKKYKKLTGIMAQLPLTKRQIPIIADKKIDPEFGTGALKVTPAHSSIDFEMGERHKLEFISVIGQDGKMTSQAGKDYKDLKVKDAREKIIKDLKKLNLLVKTEKYTTPVAKCYKCNNAIEPLILPQWYLKVDDWAQQAMQAVKDKKVKFIPARFEKIFMHWMQNIKPWNISRQIVWGIKIPIKYCECGQVILDIKNNIKKCPKCNSKDLFSETDTFDTWFSSGQWPVITLRTTAKDDLNKFYSTSVMETGWDILFFWVARMIMFGLYLTGEVPFKYVYLHGLVRDKDRQKMSKSKGNVIDPLGVVEEYGSDAFRMALVFGVGQGNDVALSTEKIIAHKKFANKIWNAAKFVISNLDGFDGMNAPRRVPTNADDKKILNKLNKTTKKVTADLDNFMFHEAAQEIYQFFWHDFCDIYLEKSKSRLSGQDEKDKKIVQSVLYKVLLNSLKLLHPFMPFITEKIYQELPAKNKKALIIEEWPN